MEYAIVLNSKELWNVGMEYAIVLNSGMLAWYMLYSKFQFIQDVV